MAISTGMTRIMPCPTGTKGASGAILLRVYSSKHSAMTGYFSHISLLPTIISMTPGTQMGRKNLSPPSFLA